MVVPVSPKAGEKGGGEPRLSRLDDSVAIVLVNLKAIRPSPASSPFLFGEFGCSGEERRPRQVLSEAAEAAGESFPWRLAQQRKSMPKKKKSKGRQRGTIHQCRSFLSFFSFANVSHSSAAPPKLSSLEEPCAGPPRSRKALCSAARRLAESRGRERHRIVGLDNSRPRPSRPWPPPPQTAPPPRPPQRQQQ